MMRKQNPGNVPKNRQALDVYWLERVQREGLAMLLPRPADPPPPFFKSIDEFNEGKHWHSHETMEEVWQPAPYPQRLFYYALIKTAVGYVHLGRHNEKSAVSQFIAAKAYLEPFLPTYLGLRIQPVYDDVVAWLERLRQPGPLSWEAFDQVSRPRILLALS